MSKSLNLTGLRYGRLTVTCRSKEHIGRVWWNCRCDCGNEKAVPANNLRIGKTQSCGCLAKEQLQARALKHGMAKTPLYNVWRAMKNRCYWQKHPQFALYGGRGITVCDEWMSFPIFHKWAIEAGYSHWLSIDRIDVNGNYEPANCKWSTPSEQARNTRRTARAPDGTPWATVAEQNGISNMQYNGRVHIGWSHEMAATWPPGKPTPAYLERERDELGRFGPKSF